MLGAAAPVQYFLVRRISALSDSSDAPPGKTLVGSGLLTSHSYITLYAPKGEGACPMALGSIKVLLTLFWRGLPRDRRGTPDGHLTVDPSKATWNYAT
jgi:hypothetical protein